MAIHWFSHRQVDVLHETMSFKLAVDTTWKLHWPAYHAMNNIIPSHDVSSIIYHSVTLYRFQ